MDKQPATKNTKRSGRAIIMGASMAGLWTARALSDHFEEVIVLERDALPEEPVYRSGTPQARQFHTLLQSGLQQMKEWFPGIEAELIAAGAVSYDLLGDLRISVRNRWYPQFSSEYVLLSCSRPLLETTVRNRLRHDPRICFMEGVDVVGLQADADKRRVTGVLCRTRHASSAKPEGDTVHSADFIVDTLGRRSQTPEWLVEHGYAAPRESEVDSFLGYVTRKYERKPNTPILAIGATPPHDPYAAVVFPEEDNTMVALIAGYNKNYPPTDPDEFEASAYLLGPEFQGAISGAEPLSKPTGYRGTSSRWRHYEQLDRWPERFVVLGDAFCGFNPIYGQGMSVAALSAAALAKQIQNSNNLDNVARTTLQEISKITQGAWLLATSADLEWPGTEGGTLGNSAMQRFGRWYIDKLLDATVFDKKVRLAFIAVQQLVKPASSLFAPDIFTSVMRYTLFEARKK